ncbi:conserved membrane hypothetical protein [Candidatus Zixiibacteriota bacterium]|nr:conserved membrane hypothetical protein [candidate division Zixibacteria bacterium]
MLKREENLLSGTFVNSKKNNFDRANAIVAGLVFLITFIIYYMTKAPTLSFWDCGEFIASAYILGVPHPPGSPLVVILGRFFTMLPIAADMAVRVNLLSVVSSAAAALFGYLVAVRLIRHWYDDNGDIYRRITIYIGGFTGALFMALANTQWGNSVEAEVYALAILLMMIIYWLALRYFDERGTPAGNRIMLLIPFLALLGVGIHLTIYVMIPVLALYFILDRKSGAREWAVVSFFFFIELYFIFELSSRPGEIPMYLPVLILFTIFLFHAALMHKIERPTLIAIGLYLVTLFPLYPVMAEAFARHLFGKEIGASLEGIKNIPLGWIGLAALTIWGLIGLFKFIGLRRESAQSGGWLVMAIYALAPATLLLVGLIFDGYRAFLILTVACIAAVAWALWKHINWMILAGVVAISLVIIGFWPFIWGLVVGLAVIIGLGLYLKDISWRTAIFIVILAAIGYSIHVYIPIRSARQPTINENNPSQSLTALVGYLERKQYGAESMTARMFVRRGEWVNQFGDYRRMGFWHFFRDQYGFPGGRFFFVLILGLFGIWETIRRKPDIGLPFLVLILICSVGLVLYMNFADGTRIDKVTGEDYLEVRDRDYFFTPAFVFFGLAIGLGIAAVIDLIRDAVKKFSRPVQKSVFGISCLMVLLPLFPLTANYFYNDRSRNYMPYDYANNLLMTCGKDAIMVTNGDNDTFPVWCLQDVYGIRQDVRVVNLSLANMGWYIKQLRDQLKVPIMMDDAAIDGLRAYYNRDTKGVMRVQDQVLEHIITANNWKYPVYMTVSTPESSKKLGGKSIQDNLVLDGMLYKLSPISKKDQVDYDDMKKFYTELYSYRGIADPNVYKDENAARLTGNYAQGFLILADSLRKAGNLEGAFAYVRQGLKVLPESSDLYGYGVTLLTIMKKDDTIRTFINNAEVPDKTELLFNWAITARHEGRLSEAINILETIHAGYPDYVDAYRALVAMYYQNKYYGKLRQLVTDWVQKHPDDDQSRQLFYQIQNVETGADTAGGGR